MNQERILSLLLSLAEQLDVEIREEEGDFNGGWCKIQGERYIFLNKKHNTAKKIAILGEALSQQSLAGLYVLPAVRELLEDFGKTGERGEG